MVMYNGTFQYLKYLAISIQPAWYVTKLNYTASGRVLDNKLDVLQLLLKYSTYCNLNKKAIFKVL